MAFPANLNVVAALSLAGIGPERTRVVLVADPAETRNVHEIRATGAFGEMTLRFANLPSADNPKTSALAPVRGAGAAAAARRGDPGRELRLAVPGRTGNGCDAGDGAVGR